MDIFEEFEAYICENQKQTCESNLFPFKIDISTANSVTLQNFDIPLKVIPESKRTGDFDIIVGESNSSPPLIYNVVQIKQYIDIQRSQDCELNAQDPQRFGILDYSENKVKETIENNLKDLQASEWIEELDSKGLIELRENLIKDAENFILRDYRLYRQNNLTTNYIFDCLNGEFIESIVVPIANDSKNFSLESKHHEPGGKSFGFKNSMLKDVLETNRLEWNSGISTFGDIQSVLRKWKEVTIPLMDSDRITFIDEQNSKVQLQKSKDLLDILNLASHIPHNEEDRTTVDRPDLQYSSLWNAISSQVYFLYNQLIKIQFDFVEKNDREEQKLEEENTSNVFQLNLLNISREITKSDISDTQSLFESKLTEQIVKGSTTQAIPTSSSLTTTQYRWAIQDNVDLTNFYDKLPRAKFAIQFPFELDDFQKRAILHLENKESVFVAAHTSAGKTVVAEYAIALAKKHMTRAIYTSPIKALSNQKYRDFCQKFDSVGILTGDVTLKPEAGCLIVTTEVLRSMLYKGSDIVRDIEWVIFDEVHYVNNAERGVVWEETIIMLPEHIGIIMLSATVPNAMEFANWVGLTKKRKIFVQTTYKRPTPLEHSIYIGGKFFIIKNKEGQFLVKDYENIRTNIEKQKKEKDDLREQRKADLKEKFEEKGWKFKDDEKKNILQRKKLNQTAIAKNTGQESSSGGQDRWKEAANRFNDLIRHCQKQNLLPCVFFAFSKKQCTELAFKLSGLDLTTKEEQKKILSFYNSALKRLKDVDRELPQLISLRDILSRGIAIHHGDLLPIAKEVVEILFADGLIKVLFATETFAMGVNMPAKTVVFCGLMKHDGKDLRNLKSSEYTQMSGRAGRRGLDDKGNVFIYIRDTYELPQVHEIKTIVENQGEMLQSKFRLTYGIIFNLLLAKELDVVEVMKRSYVEHGKVNAMPEQQRKLKEMEVDLTKLMKSFDCKFKPYSEIWPIEEYTNLITTLKIMADKLWKYPLVQNKIHLPKFAIILGTTGEIDVGILISKGENDKYKCFTTEHVRDNKQKALPIAYEATYISEMKGLSGFINDTAYKVFEIEPGNIIDILEEKIQIEKFDKEVILLLSELLQISNKKIQQDIAELLKQSKQRLLKSKNKSSFPYNLAVGNKNEELIELYTKVQSVRESIMGHLCHTCELKFIHLEMLGKREKLKEQINLTKSSLSDDNLAYMDEFENRIKILQELNYLDSNKIPLIKARVGRELGSADIFLAEVLMENILDNLEPEMVAALLSSFVCQIKRTEFDFNDELPDSLKEAMDQTDDIINNILDLEIKYHVISDESEAQETLKERINFGLVKVVYEWACQKSFAEICQLTDAQEGSIVRTILRLDILLRDLKGACRIMGISKYAQQNKGNMKLQKLVEEASRLIRRDIVFAGSLYLE